MQDEEKESLLDGAERRTVSERTSMFNIIILSVGMLFVFSAFNAVQNYMTTLKGAEGSNVGTLSLGILYIVFAIMNLVAPLIVGKLGLKWSLVAGSVTYVIFVLSCIAASPVYLYVAAGVIGVGAATLWTAHGAFLTASTTDSNRGRLVGLFWGIFWGNAILGSIGGGVIFSLHLSNYVFYLIFVGVGGFGVLLLFLLRPVAGQTDVQVPPSLLGVLRMIIDRGYVPLHLLVAYSALSESYFYGVVTYNVGRSQWGTPFVGYVMTAAGVAEFIGSLVAGRMSDRVGRRPVFLVSVGLQAISMFLGWWAGPLEGKYNFGPYAFFFAAFVFGLADAGLVTMLYSTIGSMYTTRSKEAFATFKLVQSIAMGAAFLYAVKLEDSHYGHAANVLIIAGVLVVGTAVGTMSFPSRKQMDEMESPPRYDAIVRKGEPRAVNDGFATRLDSGVLQ